MFILPVHTQGGACWSAGDCPIILKGAIPLQGIGIYRKYKKRVYRVKLVLFRAIYFFSRKGHVINFFVCRKVRAIIAVLIHPALSPLCPQCLLIIRPRPASRIE